MILVLNCGSSSIKFTVLNTELNSVYLSGLADRIGQLQAQLSLQQGDKFELMQLPDTTYQAVLVTICQQIKQRLAMDVLDAVGHRVVHGGEQFVQSVLIDDVVLEKIKQCQDLAPLHNPANILGITLARQAFPQAKQVAVFDTAFHQSMPDYAYIYPIPYYLYQRYNIRRYGFHGTSHRYVAQQAAQVLQLSEDQCHFISLHLGNGCSATAIKAGKSVDTSMGLTPLEGLMMGTRSGDVDPGLTAYLAEHLAYSNQEIQHLLNQHSGLLGISGQSADMRDIHQLRTIGDKRAQLAFEIFCYRVSKTVGALAMVLEDIAALIFTGGIGEHDAQVRAQVVARLAKLNFLIDNTKNDQHDSLIQQAGSIPICVIKTDEEHMIAQDTLALIAKRGS